MPFMICVITLIRPQRGKVAKDQPNSLDNQPGRTVRDEPKEFRLASACRVLLATTSAGTA